MSEQKHNSFVNVTVVKDDAVDENHLFIGDHKEICELANKKFIDLCKQNFSNWDDYTPDDIEAILDDGLADFGRGTICITWPEITLAAPLTDVSGKEIPQHIVEELISLVENDIP